MASIRLAGAAACVVTGLILGTPAQAAEGALAPLARHWAFDGLFGHFDRAAAQRGLQVYREVCAACHALDYIAFRNLAELGYSEDEVKALAAEHQVTDGPDDAGEMFERAGPADRPLPGAVRQRRRGARLERRRAAARSVADHQGARRRQQLL